MSVCVCVWVCVWVGVIYHFHQSCLRVYMYNIEVYYVYVCKYNEPVSTIVYYTHFLLFFNNTLEWAMVYHLTTECYILWLNFRVLQYLSDVSTLTDLMWYSLSCCMYLTRFVLVHFNWPISNPTSHVSLKSKLSVRPDRMTLDLQSSWIGYIYTDYSLKASTVEYKSS